METGISPIQASLLENKADPVGFEPTTDSLGGSTGVISDSGFTGLTVLVLLSFTSIIRVGFGGFFSISPCLSFIRLLLIREGLFC